MAAQTRDYEQMLSVSNNTPASPTVRSMDSIESRALDAFSELDAISLKEVLDSDSRPMFVLDLDSDYVEVAGCKDEIRPIFMNAALRSHDRLLDSVTGASTEQTASDSDRTTYDEFHSWATGVTKFDDSRDVFPSTLIYQGLTGLDLQYGSDGE
jgi:hypothetical protein